ncbi:MAG: glycosyltransferase [Flavobacteriales bacterium]|nr:glycosyltransferase [Flavobacteriales bacterium]
MSGAQPSLDLIIPCFNPEPGWERNLIEHYTKLKSKFESASLSLIVVDDGSTQTVNSSSREILEEGIEALTYIEYEQNRGKGYALRQGVAESSSDLIIFTDVDFPYELESVIAIYNELTAGVDVALGFRQQEYYIKVPLFRKVLSRILRWLLKVVLKLEITDSQCGLKGFNATGKEIFMKTKINRFLFDLEFVMLLSRKSSAKATPVLVKLRDGVTFSKVNLKILTGEVMNFFKLVLLNKI